MIGYLVINNRGGREIYYSKPEGIDSQEIVIEPSEGTPEPEPEISDHDVLNILIGYTE